MKILFACMLLLLAGCGITRPDIERQSFLVEPEYAGSPGTQMFAGTLRIGGVDVARPFDGREFVYRRDEVRYESDFYNEFAADPAHMLAEATARWLQRSGLFAQVLSARTGAAYDYRLEAGVSAMYVDFRGRRPAAVLSLHWRLLRGAQPNPALDLDCEERVELAELSPRGSALAYGEALKQALARLEAALKVAKL